MATTNAMSDYLENKILNDYLVTGTPYVALYITDPGETGTAGTEVAGGGYAKKPVTFTVTASSASNSADVNFGQASASWGNVAYFAILDGSSGTAKVLFHGALENGSGVPTTFAVNNGDTFKFPASSLTISLD